jgi:ubiquinone/menaquinone biosynthesis C-methylase UbiE
MQRLPPDATYTSRTPFGDDGPLSVQQWETYHRGGAIATCPTAADGGYDLEVRAAWVEFFSTLPEAARVLDVGTGNGVVASIAAETGAVLGRRWEIHATDLADINPMRDVSDAQRRLAGITFHSRTPTERLPFESHYFDAVCGHYALEYTDVAAALAELHRVLKPGGNAQFIVHHVDSVLVQTARASMREADLVFTETKAYRRLHRLVAMEEVGPRTQRTADEVRSIIRTLKKSLEEARARGEGRILAVALDGIQKLLTARKTLPAPAVALEVDRAEAEMRASVRRLNDLIEHARSAEAMDSIQATAEAAGFSLVEYLPQYHATRNLIGWQLLMHRA